MLAPRRLTAAALLAAACGVPVVAGAPGAAAAPPRCPSVTVQDATKAADAVFRGTVEQVDDQELSGRRGTAHVQQVTVDLVWKGGISTEEVEVVTSTSPTECDGGLGRLAAGTDYVFFVDRGAQEWTASASSRTGRATDELVAQVVRLRGAGEAPVAPEPETAEFTRVADGDPAPLGRTAAPGLAMVIVGLLGLAVVRRLGRR